MDRRSSSGRSNQQSNTVHVPPVSNFGLETISHRIDVTKNLIERCIQLYMTKNEVIATLFENAKIEHCFTECVWQKLEEENPEFFKAYYVKLKLIDQINTFNHLLEQQYHMTKMHNSGIQVQQSPPGLPAGNPAIQQPRIPFQSADHGSLLGMQMNSGNDGRMGGNENVASNSQFHHLPSDMSWGFDSASESHFERIPQSPRLGLDGEQKSSTRVLTSDPNADLSNLPDLPTGYNATQQPPIPFPSADYGSFHGTQLISENEMMWNGDVASNGQFLCPPSDMSWGFDSASKSHSERIPQSLRLGLDGEPKSSTGVLTSDPTADWSALPGLATGYTGIQQHPIPSPSAGHGNMQVNYGNEMVVHPPSEMSRAFDSAFKSHFEKPIPEPLRMDLHGEVQESSTRILPSHPTADFSNPPDSGYIESNASLFSDDSTAKFDLAQFEQSDSEEKKMSRSASW